MQIEDYIYGEDLYQSLMYGNQMTMLDRKILGVVRLSLSHNIAFNIAKETPTASLMEALVNMYGKPYAMNKVYVMYHIFKLRMA